MFQVLQLHAWNNSIEAFATGSSASQHSDVTVRLFESDTRVVERARLRVHSALVSGKSTRLHADFTTIVILNVTVRLVSMLLVRCPGKSDFRSRQVTSTQRTQLTLERLDLALHGGKGDGIDLATFSLGLTGNHAYRNVDAECNRLDCDARQTELASSQCCNQHSPVSLLNIETW